TGAPPTSRARAASTTRSAAAAARWSPATPATPARPTPSARASSTTAPRTGRCGGPCRWCRTGHSARAHSPVLDPVRDVDRRAGVRVAGVPQLGLGRAAVPGPALDVHRLVPAADGVLLEGPRSAGPRPGRD